MHVLARCHLKSRSLKTRVFCIRDLRRIVRWGGERLGMAICWSCVWRLLLLTVIIAFHALRKSVPQTPGITVMGAQTRDQLESLAASTFVRQVDSLHQELPSIQVITSETTNSAVISEQQQLPINSQDRRRRRSRKLIESHSSSSRPKDKSLLEYRLPQRSATSVFGTDRLVPTGPNPLHNSNTTEVWYP